MPQATAISGTEALKYSRIKTQWIGILKRRPYIALMRNMSCFHDVSQHVVLMKFLF